MSSFLQKTIVGPHNHPFSLDSGNTVKHFITSAAKDFGRKAIAVTDHGTIGAIIEAHEISKDLKKKGHDITIIPGVELYLLPDTDEELKAFKYYHLTVHFNDFNAYLDGCKLSRSAFDRGQWKGGEFKPFTTWDELKSLSGKVTILSGCLIGPCIKPLMGARKDIAERNFQRLMDIAGPGRFFAEIFPYEVSKNWNRKTKQFEPIDPEECFPSGKLQVDANEWIFHLASKYSIPTVVSEDAHYAHEAEKPIQDIRLNKDGQDNWKMSDANCMHTTEWLHSELKRLHPTIVDDKKFEEMIDNSYAMLDTFKGFEPKFSHALPSITIETGDVLKSDDDIIKFFVDIIIKEGRIDLSNEIYLKRLRKEIKQLAQNGKINILPYFMPLYTIVKWCRDNDVLVGPGRGSAAGSLFAYALGITAVDPIKEGLSFERFFDVTRVEEGLADIDTDFSNKNKVVDFIKETWGDCFAYLGIGTTFKTKSALHDIDRLMYGKVRDETLEICKTIPSSPQGIAEDDFLKGYVDADGIHQMGQLETNPKLVRYLETNPKNAELLFKMVGIIRQMGRHAAGVLIADKPIHSFIPVTKVSDEFTTQLLPKWVEKCGGVKYDILGVNTLEDIRLCLNLIKSRHGISIDPWKIEDDPEFWKSAVKDPITIFQLHTKTVRPGLRAMKPKNVQEAAILTSVYRPGAMDAISDEDPGKTMDQIFIERWTGQRPVTYLHPDLEDILGPTKATTVFQEQIMDIVHKLGGLTMPETNQLRKAISKKSGDALIKLLNKVKANLVSRGWTEDVAATLCDQMKAAGKYCFNKSHGISYSYIARACAYFKHYYPIEWWTAVLSNASKEDLKSYWSSVSQFVDMPSINESTDVFTIKDSADGSRILSPLNMIEGVGPAVLKEIAAKRPFTDLESMLKAIDKRIVNKRVMIKLILSGILDFMFDKDATNLEKITQYLKAKALVEGKRQPEEVPSKILRLTAMQQELIKKTIYKVYTGDIYKASIPEMLYQGLLKESSIKGSYSLKLKDGAYHIASAQYYEDMMSSPDSASFAMVGYVSEAKERKFQNNTKTMLAFNLEVDDKVIECVKFPNWEEFHHGIEESIEDSVCAVVFYKKYGSNRAVVQNIKVIQSLDFDEEKKKDDKPSRTVKKRNSTG